MDWARQGADWPNRESSFFLRRGVLTWHVQRMGAGPVVLLAHGTGSATHSWRALMPALARDFDVIAVDLPGHGFTSAPPSYRLTLPEMAAGLADLVQALGVSPAMLVGHSAGAAIMARMVLDGAVDPAVVVALNGALLPLPGVHGQFFGGAAKMIAMMPVLPWFFAWRAQDRSAVARMIAGTGSTLDEAGLELYARLLRDQGHVGNVLAMMANWELEGLARDLPKLGDRLVLVAAEGDRAVPVKVARKVEALVPGARVVLQAGLGHLSHEEAPAETAALLARIFNGKRSGAEPLALLFGGGTSPKPRPV
jgi:magnesium chelatase accessory protein